MKLDTILGTDGDAPATRFDLLIICLALLLGWQARGAWDDHINEGADKRIVAVLCYGIRSGLLTVNREAPDNNHEPAVAPISPDSEREEPPSCEDPPPEE